MDRARSRRLILAAAVLGLVLRLAFGSQLLDLCHLIGADLRGGQSVVNLFHQLRAAARQGDAAGEGQNNEQSFSHISSWVEWCRAGAPAYHAGYVENTGLGRGIPHAGDTDRHRPS